jgi:hypothetical protein
VLRGASRLLDGRMPDLMRRKSPFPSPATPPLESQFIPSAPLDNQFTIPDLIWKTLTDGRPKLLSSASLPQEIYSYITDI